MRKFIKSLIRKLGYDIISQHYVNSQGGYNNMSKICSVCGKGPIAGRTIVRRGMAKAKGGVGKKIVRTTKRRFLPNLVTVRAMVGKSKKTIKVCAQCLKSGKVKKAI